MINEENHFYDKLLVLSWNIIIKEIWTIVFLINFLINTLYFIVMFLLSLISSFCALFMYFPTENRPSNFGRKSRMILLRFCDTRALVRKNISFIRIGLRIYSERQICALQALCCFQFFLFSLSLSLSPSLTCLI